MLFAAGLGTRLRPLTDRIPKALVPVGGVPILERVARRVIAAGADRLVINVSHRADQVERFVREMDGFGVDVAISREEPGPLETGGGLKKAAPLLRRDGPFVVHNADVLTDLSLAALLRAHEDGGAIATLAVLPKDSARYLLFDDEGLAGHGNHDTGGIVLARQPGPGAVELGFTGVHVAAPALLDRIEEEGVFSIFTTYLRLVREGERIAAFRADGCRWIDIGTPERLAEAEAAVGSLR